MPLTATPEWLIDAVREKAHLLRLDTWTLNVSIVLCVNGDEHVLACCQADPNVNYAALTFRADIEDDDDWHEVIWHELLHVAHAAIDQVVDGVIVPELDDVKQSMAQRVYTAQVERYTDLMAKMLNVIYPRASVDDEESDDDTADTE